MPILNRLIEEHQARFVDLRFTDTLGKEHHMTVPSHQITKDFIKEGKAFDGSSIKGWQGIESSDMVLLPDVTTAMPDPFFEESTISVRCDVIDPATMNFYGRDPRALARRAEHYLINTGIADTCFMGPEPEFFIFDDVKWHVEMGQSYYQIDAQEAAWNSGAEMPGGNFGHRPAVKGGYFPLPPVDSCQNIRSAMCLTLEDMGLYVEAHHHEVGTAGQNEISTRFNSLLKKADEVQILKYVVRNVAHAFGKTATFMPKPLVGDNGSGMHVHQSLSKDGKNLFAGDDYAGLSKLALHYIGGIIHHARAINAFTNSTTNSYRRLVPGFEAPVLLAYSSRNRSAAIRVPYVPSPKGARIEVRFPDAIGNPYLGFAAMLMAGLDGIERKIDPGVAMDKDLYHLSCDEMKKVPTVCSSLEQSLEALHADHAFLLKGGVFTKDVIDAYTQMKMEEVTRIRMLTHPAEFEMYYSN